jgi:aminopeptidase
MEQISYFPSHFLKGKVDEITHIIDIIAEADKYELQGVNPKKLATKRQSRKPYLQRRIQKELEGKLTRVKALYGTPAMAEDVGMSPEEYRDQIITACYLDYENPVQQREKTQSEIEIIRKRLTDLQIQKVHIEGTEVDLRLTIGADRQRM